MTDPRHGDVILYSYLWAREYDRGEESGRKARPTCVMLIVVGKAGKQVAAVSDHQLTTAPEGASGSDSRNGSPASQALYAGLGHSR